MLWSSRSSRSPRGPRRTKAKKQAVNQNEMEWSRGGGTKAPLPTLVSRMSVMHVATVALENAFRFERVRAAFDMRIRLESSNLLRAGLRRVQSQSPAHTGFHIPSPTLTKRYLQPGAEPFLLRGAHMRSGRAPLCNATQHSTYTFANSQLRAIITTPATVER